MTLEPRRDAEARHRRRDDGESEHAGDEEVDGLSAAVRQDVHEREEREDPDGDSDRDEEALAAPEREEEFDLRLRPDAPRRRS